MNEGKKEAEILDHEYDGIREFDNPLPSWWLLTFYGAIVFSVFYVAYYHFGPGPSLEQELSQDLAQVNALAEKSRAAEAPPSEEQLHAALLDADTKALGKKIFIEKCAACHGALGEGQIGPNLTDKFWIHGNGELAELLTLVSQGVPDKGMPPWSALLDRAQLIAAAVHVRSLRGTSPPNAKAPQGTEVKQ